MARELISGPEWLWQVTLTTNVGRGGGCADRPRQRREEALRLRSFALAEGSDRALVFSVAGAGIALFVGRLVHRINL